MERQRFDNLALEHLDAVYRLAMQLTRHPSEASDLVQETYLKALRAAERFEEHGGAAVATACGPSASAAGEIDTRPMRAIVLPVILRAVIVIVLR